MGVDVGELGAEQKNLRGVIDPHLLYIDHNKLHELILEPFDKYQIGPKLR